MSRREYTDLQVKSAQALRRLQRKHDQPVDPRIERIAEATPQRRQRWSAQREQELTRQLIEGQVGALRMPVPVVAEPEMIDGQEVIVVMPAAGATFEVTSDRPTA